jgi:hypothetical protein
MQKILEQLQITNNYDVRQQGKIKYALSEIIDVAFFAMTANADDYVDNCQFCRKTPNTS